MIPRESFADMKSRDLKAAILLLVVTQEGMPEKIFERSDRLFFFCCDLFVIKFLSFLSYLLQFQTARFSWLCTCFHENTHTHKRCGMPRLCACYGGVLVAFLFVICHFSILSP